MKKTIKFEVEAEIEFDKPEGEETATQSAKYLLREGGDGIGIHVEHGGYKYKISKVTLCKE